VKPWKVILALVSLAFVAGGAVGEKRYEGLVHPEALCGTCHHAAGPSRVETAPHSLDFKASCHLCHALPVKQYLTYVAARVGTDVPDAVRRMKNPVIDDQSCLECHLSHGRGDIPCEKCHREGTSEVDTGIECAACHIGHTPIPPHDTSACRDCHPDATWGPIGQTTETSP
jgi:hypothetical protein